MSRTKKGSKAPGAEYWSRRPMSGSTPGRWSKTMTHRRERLAAKDVVRSEVASTTGDGEGRS